MDVRAVLLLGSEKALGQNLSLAAVLGKSVLERTVDMLVEGGVNEIKIVAPETERHLISPRLNVISSGLEEDWELAEQVFGQQVSDGADVLIFMRVGAYAEVGWKELIECHGRERLTRVTRVWNREWPLDIFIVNGSRRNEGITLLRSRMQRSRSDCSRYAGAAYVNLMRDARDLRQLASDGLQQRCQLRPVGLEVRPGIWLGEDARVDKGARLVAPVYVGKRARVHAGAVVTRAASIEHHSVIDCGTVIENSTVLPYSRAGVGLDFAHTVLSGNRMFHLKRNAEVTIADKALLAQLSPSPVVRLAESAKALVGGVPQFFVGMIRREPEPTCAVVSTDATNAAARQYGAIHLAETDEHSPLPNLTDFAVARRYGNQ